MQTNRIKRNGRRKGIIKKQKVGERQKKEKERERGREEKKEKNSDGRQNKLKGKTKTVFDKYNNRALSTFIVFIIE